MRIFITGATGFIGLAVTRELTAAGHQVSGLCRSDDKAAALKAAGGTVHCGALEDMDSLKSGVAAADGVIHLAFNHDFSRYMQNCEDDRRVVQALGGMLKGSRRPLLITSGTGMTNTMQGEAAKEDGPFVSSAVLPRAASEEAANDLAAGGINVSVVRLPQVHDTVRQGLVTYAVAVARQKGFCAYVGGGQNRWPAAHISDVARLYWLALEKAEAGAKYHAVAEEGISMRSIMEALGERLKLPVQSIAAEKAQDYFGWLAPFAARDLPASSAQTRARLDWQPIGPGLIADLERLVLPAL